MSKTNRVSPYERQLNLIVALLNARSYLTAEQIRTSVAGYEGEGEAFRQMFERDKRDLQSLGIPLRVGRDDTNPRVDGYRIFSDDYTYAPIDFTSDEIRTLSIAVQLFTEEGYGDAQRGFDKLQPAHSHYPEFSFVDSRAQLSEKMLSNLSVLSDAAAKGIVVEFPYHTAKDFSVKQRRVEPWGIVADQGNWYCLAYDQEREDTRVFRVSRIAGEVTATGDTAHVDRPNVTIRELLEEKLASIRNYSSAVVMVQKGSAQAIVNAADRVFSEDDVLRCEFDRTSSPWLLAAVLAEGDKAWVTEPAHIREQIIHILENIATRNPADSFIPGED